MPNGWSALLALWLLAQTLGNEPVSTPMCAASFKVNGADETITLAAGATHDEAWRVSTAFVQKHSLTDGHGLQGDPDGVAARIARELRARCGLNDACARAVQRPRPLVFVSLGHACHAALNLRLLGLRAQSLPLDWLRIRPDSALRYATAMLASGFRDFVSDLVRSTTTGYVYARAHPEAEFMHQDPLREHEDEWLHDADCAANDCARAAADGAANASAAGKKTLTHATLERRAARLMDIVRGDGDAKDTLVLFLLQLPREAWVRFSMADGGAELARELVAFREAVARADDRTFHLILYASDREKQAEPPPHIAATEAFPWLTVVHYEYDHVDSTTGRMRDFLALLVSGLRPLLRRAEPSYGCVLDADERAAPSEATLLTQLSSYVKDFGVWRKGQVWRGD